MLFGLAVLALFKTGGCVSYWYMHSVGSFCFFTFGFGLLFVQVFARRGDGAGCRCGARCARDLAFFAGWTRSKAIAALEPAMSGLKDLTTTNAGLVSAMQGLTRGLEHVPAELLTPAGTTA